MAVKPFKQSLTANTPTKLNVVDALNDGQISVYVTWISGGNVSVCNAGNTISCPLPAQGFSFNQLGCGEAASIWLVADAAAEIAGIAQGV